MEIPTFQNCDFYAPIYWSGGSKNFLPLVAGETGVDGWQYSKMTCYSTTTNDVFTLIENSTTGAKFYLDKTLNYGDSMILWFLTIFSFIIIFKSAYHFFWKK